MESRIARARESVDSAAELTDDSTIHEQLESIRQGLNALSGDLPDEAVSETEVPSNASPDADAPVTASSSEASSGDSTEGTSGDAAAETSNGDRPEARPNDPSSGETPETDVPADATPDDDSQLGERIEQVERQLAELGDDAEGRTAEHIANARDHLDAFRRARARDWE